MFAGEDTRLSALIADGYSSAPLKGEYMQAVRSHPSVMAVCSRGSTWMDGYVECLKVTRPDATAWLATLHGPQSSESLLVSDTESLAEFVRQTIARNRTADKPAPPKVLTKMLALRLENFHALVEKRRSETERARGVYRDMIAKEADEEKRAAHVRRIAEFPDLPVLDPETADAAAVLRWIEGCKALDVRSDPTWELENLLLRSDMTPEVVRDALDQFTVQRVLKS